MLFDVKKIIRILDSNKIDYDSKFASLRGLSFPNDECVDFAEELVKKIELLAIYGLNNKMREVEKLIVRLIDTTIKLGSNNANKKLIKIKREIENDKELKKIMAKVKNNEIDVRIPFRKYLESTKKGVNVLLERNIKAEAKINVKCLQESKSMLEEIEAKLNSVVDFSSKKALSIANECVALIQDYRFKASENVYTSDATKYLKDIMIKLDNWEALSVKISMFNPIAKMEELVDYSEDEFEYTVLNADFMEKVEAFKENIEQQEKSINSRYSTASLEEYGQGLKTEYELKKSELETLINKIRNGITTVEDSSYELGLLDEQCDDLKEGIQDNLDSINDIKSSKVQALGLLNRIKEIYRKINLYVDDNILFGVMAEQLDFGGLMSIARGVLNENDVEIVLTDVENVLRYIEEIKKNQFAYQQKMNDIYDKYKMRNRALKEKMKSEKTVIKNKDEQKTKNINDLINKYNLGSKIVEPEKEKTEKEKEENKEEDIIKERDITKF